MNAIFKTLNKQYIKFEQYKISVVFDKNGHVWFNGNEMALALGYNSEKDAVQNNVVGTNKKMLRDISKNLPKKLKRHPQSMYINENGLYDLMLGCRKGPGLRFKKWLTKKVLPSIRKYGYYRLRQESDKEQYKIFERINFLESEYVKLTKENEQLKRDLKENPYPDGGMVYVIDYSENGTEIYRLGQSDNMNTRKKVHNTHSLHNREVIVYIETDDPIKVETCIRSMLYDYRYKNKKDFFICEKKYIMRAFKICKESIRKMEQHGGSDILQFEINKLKMCHKRLDKIINNCNKEIYCDN
jgi:prophage antirepressor-like protein